jgi:hypothetical protein
MVLFELRHALKNLLRTPRWSLAVVATLAIVVGSGGAMFSLLDAFVLRRLPVAAPERLVLRTTLYARSAATSSTRCVPSMISSRSFTLANARWR